MSKKPLCIHHIELAHNSQNISGGEKALIESVRYIQTHYENTLQIIHTSESGSEVYARLLGKDNKNVSYKVIGSKSVENIHPYLAFYARCFEQFIHLKRFSSEYQNVIFSHEEFLPTMLYSFFLKLLNSNSKWVFFYHMKAPSLFGGYEGEFVGRFKLPTLKVIRYILEQQFAYIVTKKSDLVLTVNKYYKDLLEKKYPRIPVYVIKRYSGVTVPENLVENRKKYDLVWMGRFHPQKGIFEIINIVKIIKRTLPDIKLVMLGGGNKELEDKFQHLILVNDLQENIEFKGFIIGDERFSYLRSAKVFIMTSFYESFGQVNLEAMKCGLPVVAYNLPVYDVFERGMLKVEPLDNSNFAAEVIKLLENEEVYDRIKNEAVDFSSDFAWEKTSKEIFDQINKIL